MDRPLIFELRQVRAGYGEIQVLWGIDMAVRAGEITALIGSNGAGKTTLMRALSGLIAIASGSYVSDGEDLSSATAARILAHGIVHVPEGRRLFGAMSIEDNLLMGAYARHRQGLRDQRETMDEVFQRFPRLKERRGQLANTLSGGERAMLVLGRALMARPKVLLLDEPSLGLAPLIVKEVFRIIADLRRSGVAILLVEQNARAALQVSDHGYVLETGAIVLDGPSDELAQDPRVAATYLGGARRQPS